MSGKYTQPDTRIEAIEKFGDLVNWSDLDALIGRLLTHIEATTLDQIARDANKSIVKSIVREWMRDLDDHQVWGNLHARAVEKKPTETSTVFGQDGMNYTLEQDRNCLPPRQ